MSNLDVLVDPLKRELAVPGEFAAVFSSTTDDDLLQTLSDAFAECQLDGYFSSYALDLDTSEVTPSLSLAGGALVTIYAGTRILRSWLRNLYSAERYVAGPVEYEVQRASSYLKEELVQLERRKADLLRQSRRSGSVVYVYDNYFTRSSVDWSDVGGLAPAEVG